MDPSRKITLAEARKEGKLDQFIADRNGHPAGDQDAFDATLNSMAGRSKSEPETSPPDCADD